jgi:hypothetical protein
MSNGVTGTAQDLYLFLRICFHDMVNPPETQVKIKALERWMSGLSHTPGKRAWGKTHRGFESRLLRQTASIHAGFRAI